MASIAGGRWHNSVSVLCNRLSLKRVRVPSYKSVFATASTVCPWKVYVFKAANLFVPERCTFSKLRICVCNCKHSLSFKGACFQSCESVCPWKVYVFKAANLYLQLQACTVCPQKGVRFQSYESVLTTASMLLCSDEFTFAKVKYGLSCDTVK